MDRRGQKEKFIVHSQLIGNFAKRQIIFMPLSFLSIKNHIIPWKLMTQ